MVMKMMRMVTPLRRAVAAPARRFVQHDAAKSTAPAAASASQQQQQQQQQTDDGAGAGTGDEPPKYKPGFFSRNPGVVLGGIVLGITAFVVRSSRGKKNFEAMQLPIADAAVISPYEAWELRSSNEITPEIFGTVREGVFNAFASGKAAISQFDRYLSYKLAEPCPQGLNKAYHLERVLLSLPQDDEHKSDVDALMVAFSMAVKGSVDDRLRCLFDLATRESVAADDEKKISQQELERLVELLLETYQVPSEKRVLPIPEEKYPIQQFKAATANDLLHGAVQAQVNAKQITSDEANARTHYTFEAFSQIMTSKTVCLWGECFANSKKRMKN